MEVIKTQTILFFNHTAKWSGGEISLFGLVVNLDRLRYTPLVVLAGEGKLAERLQALNIETIVLPLTPDIVEARKEALGLKSLLNPMRLLRGGKYVLRLARLIRKHKVDLVHCNSLKSDLIGGAAAKLARVPCVWHVRDRIDEDYLPSRIARSFRFLARHLPAGILANSKSTLQTLQLSGSMSSRSRVAHPGVSLREYSPLPFLQGTPNDRQRLILVGRITPWKGQDVFIEAAAQISPRWPKALFQIVGVPMFGEEDYERGLHEQVKRHGLEAQVEFVGFSDKVPDLLQKADIFVHASKLGEPFGKVIVEAMACGKPVIATDGGALREIVIPGSVTEVQKGETGLLVPMNSVEEMANAMEALLLDSARAALMGKNGRCRAEQLFTVEATTKEVEDLFDLLTVRGRHRKQIPRKPKSYGALL